MKVKMASLVLILFAASTAFASHIEVSGTISSNTTWTGVDTVKVTGDITVADGATLTIDPGIIVEFQDRYGLLINGRLLAEGTDADSITFVPADTTGAYNFTHTGWKGIIFAQISAAADSSKISYCKLHYMNSLPIWSTSGYYNFGAITANEYDKLVVSHTHFYNNYGLIAGGVHTSKSNIRITDCYIQNNLTQPESVAERCQGGAICVWNKTATTKYVTIERNSISENSTLFGNIIYYGPGAGGIGCYQMKGRIANNIITNNETEGNGGGLHLVGPDVPHICNNLIAENAVTTGAEPKYGNGGGVFVVDADSIILVNNTIVDNSSVRSGGGISLARFDESQAALNLVNNIIWQNTADGGPEQISLSAINSDYSINVNLYVSKTDLEGGTDDIGLAGTHTTLNIVESEWVDLDPKFSAAKNNPYELSIYSPLINACDPDTTGLLVGNTDILGNPRIYDNLVYDIIDMGAYEYQGEPSSHILPQDIYTNTLMPAQWDTIRSLWGCTVHAPAKLEFSPGNHVKFYDGRQLTVQGSLGAEGTVEDPIYFTAFDTTGFYENTHAGWSGITVASSMTDTVRLVHCFLEYGKGDEFLFFGNADNIAYYIDHCQIHKCRNTHVILWLYPSYSAFCLSNSVIHNNINDYNTGSMCLFLARYYQEPFTVSNNLFSHNYSRGRGGAICFNSTSNWDNLTMSNNTFVNNTSEQRGGALYFETTSVDDEEIKFANSIFHGNTAIMEGDNIYFSFGYCYNPFRLRNCLLEGGLSSICFDDFWDIETSFYPERIMDKDPLFVGTGDHPYALSSLSPCVNAGRLDTTGLSLPSTDMAGNPRIFDGCFDVVDIGCYEYQDEPGSLQVIYTSPADDDTLWILEDLQLTMDFNNIVYPQTGDISIYDADDLMVEQIDINNTSCVSIDDNIVTVTPESPLQPGESYYINIDAMAFKDCNEQYSAGIADDTTWNFTLTGMYNYPLTALEFDGTDDYVSGTGIDPSISTITLEAWIMHSSISSAVQRYISIGPEVAVLRYDNYDLHFYVRASDGSFTEIREPYVPGPGVANWFHLAGTYDGMNMKLYLDGECVGTNTTSGGLYTPDGGFLLSHVTETFNGTMDEVVLWECARSQQEIRESKHLTLNGTEDGLLAYWQLNEGEGYTAHDYISSASGTLYNMTEDDWVNSSIPAGFGYSNTQIIATAGMVDFPETDLSVDFTEKTGVDTVVVNKLLVPPNTEPTADIDVIFDAQYWIVNTYGGGTYTGNCTFTVSEDLTPGDETDPDRIKLYWRNDNSHSAWIHTAFADLVDADTEQATFDGQVEISQCLLCRYVDSLVTPQNVTITIIGTEVHINWDAVDGALSYKIYASEDPYSGFTEIASGITSTTWSQTVSEDEKFYYVTASSDVTEGSEKSVEQIQGIKR